MKRQGQKTPYNTIKNKKHKIGLERTVPYRTIQYSADMTGGMEREASQEKVNRMGKKRRRKEEKKRRR